MYIEYFKHLKEIQKALLELIDTEDDKEAKFQNLRKILKDSEVLSNSKQFSSFLHLISKISTNRHRGPDFFKIIEQIILYYKDTIEKYYINSEIFNIFKDSKSLLLILIQKNILHLDCYVLNKLKTEEYAAFFSPEIKKTPEDEKFEENRQKGENETYICELIRNDSVQEFITYVNRNCIPLSSEIKHSIFDTNSIHKSTNLKLIEYSAFCGSIQIFRYLIQNEIELESSIWKFAIHGKNGDLIHLLEENKIEPDFESIFKESLKCHHNDIAHYIYDNNEEHISLSNCIIKGLKYFNFEFISEDDILSESEGLFFKFCQYDYPIFVEMTMDTRKFDPNEFDAIFQYKISIKFHLEYFNGNIFQQIFQYNFKPIFQLHLIANISMKFIK